MEIRHRFANSLELIASLIRLHLRDTDTEDARSRLESVLDAVHVAGHLQAQLDAPSDGTFSALLGALAHSWSAIGSNRGVEIKVSADPGISVPRQFCSTLALMAQELVTNSLTHGFDGGRSGTVEIVLVALSNGYKVLEVKDNGAGLDGRHAPKSRPSIGLNLVRTLATQVGGNFTIEEVKSGGTVARITFPG
jgi:chemotaxis protein methyltransferase CheR